MTAISITECAKNDPYPALLSGLGSEFGGVGIHALATRFLEVEAVDFHWNARMNERHLGEYAGLDDDDLELDRIAVIGWVTDRWYVAVCVVDGDGAVHDMGNLQRFDSAWDAEGAFDAMR